MAAPRKTPTQRRAKNTVARILSATAELISEGGVEVITTNKIAERAHINIASLYQYFGNKEAVINALIEDYQNQLGRHLNDLVESMSGVPLEQAAPQVIRASMSLLRESQNIMPSMVTSLTASHLFPAARLLENRFLEAMRSYFAQQRDQLELGDIDTSIYVIYSAVSSLIVKHLSAPATYLNDEEIIEEVAKLMIGYFPKRHSAA